VVPKHIEPDEGPWHRVINAQGRISHRGDTGRATQQERLLKREAVKFDVRGRVDLRRFLYTATISCTPWRWWAEPD
jgi:alkylated DNA nucleotide flippase Atl1